MSYWGNAADENHYAFDSITAYVFLIKDRMMKDLSTVLEKSYPEQGLIASLICLRQIGERFPKCLELGFRRKDFERVKEGFTQWYRLVGDKLPADRREAIFLEGMKECELFEERILRRKLLNHGTGAEEVPPV